MDNKERFNDIEELRIAVEDAAEKVIFKHAYLISEEAQRETWALGLPITVLEGSEIVQIYPDGSRQVIGHSKSKRVKVTQRFMMLKL